VAKEHYNARGWVQHHNFDLWRGAAPINASNHGIWQTGGAWMSTHLWEHYLFSGDKQFLRETAYPLMKGAATFFIDAMVKDPKTGYLYTGPSNSPEQGGLVMGPTMDRQIVRTLFGEVIAASKILNVDGELRTQLTEMRERIAPNQIGKHGQLQEWMEDTDDPRTSIGTSRICGECFRAVRLRPMARRTCSRPRARACCSEAMRPRAGRWVEDHLWARFLDGDHAYKILQNLITPATDVRPAGRVYSSTCSTRILHSDRWEFRSDQRDRGDAAAERGSLRKTDGVLTAVQSGTRDSCIYCRRFLRRWRREGHRAAGSRRVRCRAGVAWRQAGQGHGEGS